MPLHRLNDDVLCHLAGFLLKPDLGVFAIGCKKTRKAARHDAVWRRIVFAEYEMDEAGKENPPGFVTCPAAHCRAGADAEAKSLGWFDLYKRWRAHFIGYTAQEVSLGRRWWLHMERYLLAHGAIDIFNTLNAPATEEYIDRIDRQLRTSAVGTRPGLAIPRCLRVLYRFHDGQNLALHELRLRTHKAESVFHMLQGTECNDRPGKVLLEKQMHLGLLGGCAFYDTHVVCSLLPLEHFQAASDFTFHKKAPRRHTVRLDEASGELVALADTFAEMDLDADQDPGPPLLGPDDAVVFALNVSSWQDISCHKAFLVDSVDHRTGRDAGNVYTNLSDNRPDSAFMPCVDYRRMHSSERAIHSRHSNVVGISGSLFDWLFEYLRRLESGSFCLEPAHLNDGEDDSFLMISHFQAPAESRRAGRSISGATHYRLPSSKLTFSHAQNCMLGHSVVGREGVETTFCPVFLPNFSRQRHAASSFTWTYSVRLRLLSAVPLPVSAVVADGVAHFSSDPYYNIDALRGADNWHMVQSKTNPAQWSYQYHGSLRSCGLTRRHWEIGSAAGTLEVVDGEGVIGLFPELHRGEDEATAELRRRPYTFGYQSMNNATSVPSLFSGGMVFEAAGAGAFTSRIHDMRLGVPIFLY